MKRITIIPAVLALICCAAGCTKKYGREEIGQYVKDRYGIREFRVSKEPQEQHSDSDTYTDYLWTVTEKDGTVFHVLDDYHWGMEALVNTLRDDYPDVHLINAYPDLPHQAISLQKEKYEELYEATLIGSFHDRSELDDLLDELELIASSPLCPENVPFCLNFAFPYRTIGSYEYQTGDYHGNLSSPLDRQEAATRFLLTCADLQLDELRDFSAEEIRQAVEGNSYQIGIRKDDAMYFYHDLCGSQFGYGISFGALYELLKRNGIETDGTPDHYTFIGADGNRYEISYAFRQPTESEPEGYYYLINDEKQPMDYYFYNHFTSSKIREISGLPVYQYFERNVSR